MGLEWCNLSDSNKHPSSPSPGLDRQRSHAQEIVERTGKNPQYEYIQLGCSKRAEQRMLHYARTKCLGRPFSNMGMARSILWPRQTDNSSFFCAELVAAILKEGGLMQQESNPGSATPEILYRLYKNRGALAGNPYVLRDMQAACGAGLQFSSLGHAHAHEHLYAAPRASASAAEQRHEEREALLTRQAVMAPMACAAASCGTCAARATSGGGAAFRQIGGGGAPRAAAVAAGGGATARGPAPGPSTGLNLTFNGLTMSTGAASARAHRGY